MSQEKPEMSYSNPRKYAEFKNWPSGRHFTRCIFKVEQNGRQERLVRVTMNPKTGRWCAPKKETYAQEVIICDGNDGLTYNARLTGYGHISVYTGTLFSHEAVFEDSPRYAPLKALLDEAKIDAEAKSRCTCIIGECHMGFDCSCGCQRCFWDSHF